ncbi:MAG TPA: hypothetical protein ENF94_01235 [Candidatus Woesearchaeota archaeon]|nr:MAG: hypothetical protein DRJ25_01455 [Candidatus Woesearchaeota archaeon]HDD70764.1 hypothetical protein [Candidatus Woesearchaeota archaeon]
MKRVNSIKYLLLGKLEQAVPGVDFDLVGEGGLGYIFSGEYDGKKAIFKVFKNTDFVDELPFKKENVGLTEIKHPYLMDVFDVLPQDIIVSEPCGSVSLADRILYDSRVSLEKNLVAFGKVLSAVKYLSDNNLAHTDLKPENILFKKYDNKPKIIDFDTMKKTDKIISYDIIFCTLKFAAPEVVTGFVSEKSDVFSLGSILYSILHKKAPFEEQLTKKSGEDGDDRRKKYYELLNKEPPYLGNYLVNNDIMRDLVNGMRMVDLNKRVSIDDAISMFYSAIPDYLKSHLEEKQAF